MLKSRCRLNRVTAVHPILGECGHICIVSRISVIALTYVEDALEASENKTARQLMMTEPIPVPSGLALTNSSRRGKYREFGGGSRSRWA